jgi:large subunit ribosomal protein L21
MFAVIKTGGKQYRVAADDVIKVEKVAGEPGDLVEFGEVLVLGGDDIQLGTPTVAGAAVAGQIVEQGRSGTVIVFKKRRRQNSRRKRGHRQEFTVLRITEILTNGQKAATPDKVQARPKRKAADPVSADAEAAAMLAAAAADDTAKPETKAAKPKAAAGSEGAAKPKKAPAKKAEKPVTDGE